jgi:hypothetical protein
MSEIVARTVGCDIADKSLQVGQSHNGQIFVNIFKGENKVVGVKMPKDVWEKIVKGVNSFELDFARERNGELVNTRT